MEYAPIGKSYKELMNDLKNLIKVEMDNCKGDIHPFVCQAKEGEGYHAVENRLTALCIYREVTVAAAIGILEAELNPNFLD